jgi:hypothetical protein
MYCNCGWRCIQAFIDIWWISSLRRVCVCVYVYVCVCVCVCGEPVSCLCEVLVYIDRIWKHRVISSFVLKEAKIHETKYYIT